MPPIMVFDLSTLGQEQLGFPPADLYTAIIDGLIAVSAFVNEVTGGVFGLPVF
ncbi:hypothetical protein ONR57_09905 [Hoyosella sp. YIM 151337]|uniref:hypothetical protein n=1 Tax=Hoyosella sp. YIM 151337 TaxID=2992742 RepID=UPI0022359ECD|nr:hypothetical protein [Hoyosella sp. YIM 151337]MCW4353607.1 hypothetical protein [Hoyosella sp. YIM 151337]